MIELREHPQMKLVFLHGPPASGKLTVAVELAQLTGFKLFHNHLTVDLVSALFPFGSEGFVRLREEIWLASFRQAASQGVSLIFTFAPERTVPVTFIDKARGIVELSGGAIVFVELTCSENTIEQRIEESSRASFDKLRSVDQYRELRDGGAFVFPSIPSDLTLDTTITPPQKTAQLIASHLAAAAR